MKALLASTGWEKTTLEAIETLQKLREREQVLIAAINQCARATDLDEVQYAIMVAREVIGYKGG